ncbi:hypothetical protein [Mesorhizobium sp. M0522]|uniref:hypothetical protein n=1 Tax=Mesorhizobium sp. M0522 TaxID=2956958 RepID=UPI00333C3A8C
MPRQPTTYQFDLFSNPHDAETAQMPPWQALPEETRLTLTKLMVRLILDHVDGERAVPRIETVDDDLGRSAAGGVARAGFDRMVAAVCLGKVGAVAAREVSRFARNSRDWQQLI